MPKKAFAPETIVPEDGFPGGRFPQKTVSPEGSRQQHWRVVVMQDGFPGGLLPQGQRAIVPEESFPKCSFRRLDDPRGG